MNKNWDEIKSEKILKVKRKIVNFAIPILIIYLLYINGWLPVFVKAMLIIGILLLFGGMWLYAYLATQDIKQRNSNENFCSMAEEEAEVN